MISLKKLLFESQVDTFEFKKWFGNSKVVDDFGKPLVVYHGTTKDFKSFNPQRTFSRKGIYFTDSPSVANISSIGKQEPGARSIPVYLSIQNPKVVEWEDIIQIDDKMFDFYKHHGYDGLIAKRRDGSKEFVVFDSTQIKSSIGNIGTFDSNNSDITKESN